MNNDLIHINTLPPFKRLCMTIGELPSSYTESMTYYETLVWLLNYLEKTVIPAINNNGEAVKELQTLYIELKSYVDNYFDNLDVQEEINNKLDGLVEDGTMQTLIDTYAQPILTDLVDTTTETTTALTDRVNALADEVENATEDLDTKIEKLREEKYNLYTQYNIPFTDSLFSNIQVYRSNDKQNIKVGYNLDSLKNTTATTYYVATDGSNSNNGTSESTPWATIGYAVRNAVNNSTIIVKEGIYYRNQMPDNTQTIAKNLNIYGENNVLLTQADALTWNQHTTYTNIYYATRSNITGQVIDIRSYKNNIFSFLNNVESLELCNSTINSYFYENNILYVNIGEEVTNAKVIAPLSTGYSNLIITPTDSNINVYMENLNIIGGNKGCILLNNSNEFIPTLIANKCNFLFGGGGSDNVFNNAGAKSILIDCKANYGKKDGFNYYLNNNISAKGIEINCEGSNNGLNSSDDTNNGSTAHGGSQIVRINGNYFNNKGGNVADVHENTESYNFNCNAFDSVASELGYSQDFAAQQSGTTIHLINCYSKGSSYSNLYCVTGSTMYLDNVEYNNRTGAGSFIEVE